MFGAYYTSEYISDVIMSVISWDMEIPLVIEYVANNVYPHTLFCVYNIKHCNILLLLHKLKKIDLLYLKPLL